MSGSRSSAGSPSAGSDTAQALILDESVHAEGAVGAVVSGLPVLTVVSQGCRPIGREAVITRCDGSVVSELAGMPALERLRREIAALSPEEQALAARGLLAGLVIDENRPEYDIGDFLMRGLLGADEATGALVLGDSVRVGQTLRFFVRDATSADADLRQALGAALRRGRPAGAMLFTCNGRGMNMFPEPDHDARIVTETLGTQALAGFFCGGEIGPVGGKAFLHGFTATPGRLPRALSSGAQELDHAQGHPVGLARERDRPASLPDPPALIPFRPRWGRDWLVSQHQLPDCRCPRIAAQGYALGRGVHRRDRMRKIALASPRARASLNRRMRHR
jgi:small ligand-binding sensory domain FIST